MTVLAQKRSSAGTMSLRNDFLACPASILPLPEKRIVTPDAMKNNGICTEKMIALTNSLYRSPAPVTVWPIITKAMAMPFAQSSHSIRPGFPCRVCTPNLPHFKALGFPPVVFTFSDTA